ncbi:hypothetical protein [Ensifer adhaerens]|uniref:hypothetical protein n=1 Tax=Ensifer adhaerens TaxID=106592 RepID=UPI00132F311E|nr:hypothetical protein [Ensifer adhaerens]QHG73117.1 transposase [Ensifer adhaerens]
MIWHDGGQVLSCFERDRFVWPLAAAGTVVIIPAQLGSTSADCDPLGDSRLMALASIYDAGWQEYAGFRKYGTRISVSRGQRFQ